MAEAGSVGRVADSAWIRCFGRIARPLRPAGTCRRSRSARSSTAAATAERSAARLDTRFRIASITKPFTATAAVRLLALAAPVPGWPDVSVADLLAHLTGYESEHGDPARFGDGDDALGRLAAELPATHRWLPAGEVWSYANTGYWLTGSLLAEAAGTTYEEVIAGLASEAGLEATTFGEPDLEGTGPNAIPGAYPRARRPSGGLVSTVDDLLRFGAWHLAQPELP